MTTDTSTPTEITETALDDISGGPHWTTWDPPHRGFTTASQGTTAQAALDRGTVQTKDGWFIELNRE